jgi:hypothetical protein
MSHRLGTPPLTMPETQTTPAPSSRLGFHIAIGGALGLCVGILMGMTTAPVVGTIVGALAALFATIFGVKDQDLSSFGRIGGFGALCVLGVVVGIYLRTHNSLGISAGQQVAEWTAAGFTEPVARSIVLYRELGVLVNAKGELSTTARAEKIPAPPVTTTTLSGRPEEECVSMAPSQYGDDPVRIVRSYKAFGGQWETLANALDALPPPKQKQLIRAAYDLACPPVK